MEFQLRLLISEKNLRSLFLTCKRTTKSFLNEILCFLNRVEGEREKTKKNEKFMLLKIVFLN